MRTNRKKGFTITELVIVIAVIAVLAAVLIPTFASVVSSANESKAMQNCHNALSTYRASDGMGDVDPGMVFLNNEDDNNYAYVYLGGSLERIDKLDKIAYLSGSTIDSKKKNEIENQKDLIEFNFTDSISHGKDKKLVWELKQTVEKEKEGEEPATEEKVVKSGSFFLKEELGETETTAASDPFTDIPGDLEGEKHKALTLYFYQIEVNEKNYVGWFTLESDRKNALLSLEEGAVLYSNNFGYFEVDDKTKLVFSDEEEEIKAEEEAAPGEADS